ncbi:MAG: hypothetical protein ABF384_17715 [Verrucomicrobiales bacterium]
MEIFLNEIPEEGLLRAGQFPVSLFDLKKDDPIRPVGPVEYDVRINRFDDLIVFTGSLKAPFQLQCSTCLEYVEFLANYPEWTSDLDIEKRQRSFDLAQQIREDFLLELPASPFCEDLVEGRICPKANLLEEVEEAQEAEPEEQGNPDLWNALDDLPSGEE